MWPWTRAEDGGPALSGHWAIPGRGPGVPAARSEAARAASCLRRSPTSQTSLSGGGGGPGRSALPARTKGAGRAPRPRRDHFPSLWKEKRTRPSAGCWGAGTGATSRLPPASRADCQAQPGGAPGTPAPSPGGGHSPDFGTCGGIVLAMRVHRTMCSGHRPPSSPRPMAAPAAPHRPARARTPRLRAAPCGPARGSGAARCGAAEGGGGRGAGGPAAEGSCAGGRPGRRVRARSVVGPGARVTHDFARAPRGKQETPRQQLGRTSRRPEPAPRLGSRSSPSLAAANHVLGTGPSGALANFQRPRAFPLRRLTTEH